MTTETQPLRGPLRKRKSHLWDRHPEDYYIEPHWVSERLFEAEKFEGWIYDPAVGSGRIVEAAVKAGLQADGTDLVDRGYGFPGGYDFANGEVPLVGIPNIVSNPPFSVARKFTEQALRKAKHKVALLLPAGWVQGDERSRWLAATPLKTVYFITPRPSMPPGPAIEAGLKPGNGTTDYAFFCWDRDHTGPATIGWIRRTA